MITMGRWSEERDVCVDQEVQVSRFGVASKRSGAVSMMFSILVGLSVLRKPMSTLLSHSVISLPSLSVVSVACQRVLWAFKSPMTMAVSVMKLLMLFSGGT